MPFGSFLREHKISALTMMQIHVLVDTHGLTIRNLTTATARARCFAGDDVRPDGYPPSPYLILVETPKKCRTAEAID